MNKCLVKNTKSEIMAASIGIGNFNTESVELNSSALNLHNRIQVDPSLVTGNDIYVAPTGGLTDNGPYEFTLSGDSSFHKILNLSRLFGEFHLVDPTSGELIDKTVDVSFVNNIGHSWISSIDLTNQLKAMHISPSSKIVCLTLTTKRSQIFPEVTG